MREWEREFCELGQSRVEGDDLGEGAVVSVAGGDFIAVEAFEEGHEDFAGGAEFLAEFGGGGLSVFLEEGGDGGDGSLVGVF